MKKQHLQIRLEGIRSYATGANVETRLLFIDGIYGRIVITENQNGVTDLTIDGVPKENLVVEPAANGPLVIEFPIVYGIDGVPIPYNQQLRVVSPGGAGGLRGVVYQVYLVNPDQ